MLKYLKVIFKALPAIIHAYFSWMLKYSKNPNKYPLEERFFKVQKLIRKVLKSFNLYIENNDLKEFYENCNKNENYFFVCNHLSNLDPLIFIACAKRPITFVSKIENEKKILVGRIIKILNGDFMDRNDPRQSVKIMKNIENKLNSNTICDYMIFPEGTRNKNYDKETILPYHYGSFKPAFRSKKNIVVFATFGQQKVLSFKDNKKYYYASIKKVEQINKERFENTNTVELAEEVMNKTKVIVKKLMDENDKLMS